MLAPLKVALARGIKARFVVGLDFFITDPSVLEDLFAMRDTGRTLNLGGDSPPYAAFYLYSPDRKAEHAHALLKECRSHLHADAYAGIAGLWEADPKTGAPAPLTEVAC